MDDQRKFETTESNLMMNIKYEFWWHSIGCLYTLKLQAVDNEFNESCVAKVYMISPKKKSLHETVNYKNKNILHHWYYDFTSIITTKVKASECW